MRPANNPITDKFFFNLSMRLSQVPNMWKCAYVSPIHKKGDRDKVNNYRPVSLLSIVSKIMERCIYNHIYSFISKDISEKQHGFFSVRSCNTQLLEVYHKIGDFLDKGFQTDVIYLDFSKAFDSVPHSLPIHKLKTFGFIGDLLSWLKSYLTGRKQQVVIEGAKSSWLSVTSGVPQGSILSPLLFLLYINDMPDVVSFCSISLFADDAKCFFKIRSLNDCVLLQQDIESLLMWSYIWGMDFNIDRCNVLSTRNNLPFIFEYTILDKPLQRVQHMRDLGVLINTNLTWGTHCRGLINKCNRTMDMIKRAVGFNAPVDVTTSLYRTLVRSNLEHCSSVWSPSTVSDTKAIESIQRAATRYILNYPEIKYDQRCTMLNLHPLSYRREITDLLYVFKCNKGYYDVAWHNNIVVISNSSLRSGNAGRVLRIKI